MNNQSLTIKERAIGYLYIYFPPRRGGDFVSMKYVNDINDSNDKSFNYYVRESKSFIFNTYKTSKKYGSKIFKIDDRLSNIIDSYIDEYKIKEGCSLFNLQYDRFRLYLIKIFGLTSTPLRHIYINHLYETKTDTKTLRQTADKMGHGILRQLQYRQF